MVPAVLRMEAMGTHREEWFTDLPANNGYPRTVIFYADAP
jgi:hypothetical protein